MKQALKPRGVIDRRTADASHVGMDRRDRGIISEAVLGDLRLGLAAELSLPFTGVAPALADLPAHTRSGRANTILGLLAALQAKDPYTAEHSTRVEVYTRCLAQRLGLPGASTRTIRVGALLHDVGKIGIPDSILRKPGKLTAEEFETMKSHPAIGVAIVRPIAFLDDILPMILHHHEWYDGSGYPTGLHEDEIPFGARLIQVADCIDAMAYPRSYRRDLPPETIIMELERGAGRQFDPSIAEAAIQWIRENPRCLFGVVSAESDSQALAH